MREAFSADPAQDFPNQRMLLVRPSSAMQSMQGAEIVTDRRGGYGGHVPLRS